MEIEPVTSSTSESRSSPKPFAGLKCLKEDSSSEMKSLIEPENDASNKTEAHSSSGLSWPSLWKNGPRRSAFHPYKRNPELSLLRTTEPCVADTTVMTNIQRGNIQAESPAPKEHLSWFSMAGRGDITIKLLEEMIAQGKDIDCVDDEGLSGLMWASYHGQIHTVEFFLEISDGSMVEVDREGMWGETALMLAASEGHLEIVRLLIQAGADVNHQDHSGATALMCAIHEDHYHTVNELLLNEADPSLFDIENNTAYDIAVNCKADGSKAVLEKFILSILTLSWQREMDDFMKTEEENVSQADGM